ncbi:putative exported protein [Caballeronia insecticola]|uniref:Putative exported protein n=1 Tax=Caballeronia insecticola TaxID=758793 RepID=R4WHD8_9BURK|nr:putative exported protein [Caballeronia insecticola]
MCTSGVSRLTGAATMFAALLCGAVAHAHAESPAPLGFAVIADALTRSADEAPVRRMLDAIAREGNVAFIVYDGNIKGGSEACRDGIYQSRRDLLDTSRTPLVLLLGQHDWADCAQAHTGAYDPVERLDFVRQLFFADASALGQTPLTLSRESDVARFRNFREIVRWQAQGIAFIGLNAPSPNNHYLTAGGRNGEFEDRAVATTFWLEHAAESARRTDMRALVILLQGDPDFSRYERRERFAWLRFSRSNQPRDGFLELKRSLVKAAEAFRGPVIVIHGTEAQEPNGFHIDQPLRNDKGLIVTNLTRVAIAFAKPQSQWLEVQSDAQWHPPFRLRVRNVRDVRDVRAGETIAPASEAPAMPYPSSMPSSIPSSSPSAPPSAMPRNDLPESLPAPPTMPLPASDLPPLLTPRESRPPILPVPASGVQNGSSGTGGSGQ